MEDAAACSMVGHHDFSVPFMRAGSQSRSCPHHCPGGELVQRDGDHPHGWRSRPVDFSTAWCGCWWVSLVAAGEAPSSVLPSNSEQRWRQQRRDEIKEAAPATGTLPAARWAMPEPVFAKAVRGTIANRGIFWLETSDPPPEIHQQSQQAINGPLLRTSFPTHWSWRFQD